MDKEIILNQRYEIKEILGRGGMAATYLAVDKETQQECAVKCLSLQNVDEWKTWELFERETKILKNLKHPRIPSYIDFFKCEHEHDVELYLVQEYIEGNSLAQLIQEGRHFTEQEVLNIALEMSETLEYLHNFSPRIIHRDIKPNNIILTPDNRTYLIDFGAVRDAIMSGEAADGGSTIVGTYGYMPIEQFEGRALPASDIYSLGITLIHLLSHRPPSEIDTNGLSLNFRPYVNISDRFAAILEKMILSDCSKRYQSASQVKHALEKVLRGKRSGRRGKILFSVLAGGLLLAGAWFGVSRFRSSAPPVEPSNVPVSSPGKAEVNEEMLESLVQVSHGLFASKQDELGALLMGLKAAKSTNTATVSQPLKARALSNLQDIVKGIREKNRLEGHKAAVRDVCFSADGTLLASAGSDNIIRIWNTADGTLLKTLEGHSRPVSSIDISPDGTMLASAGADNTVRLWNLSDGQPVSVMPGGERFLFDVQFSPDGKKIAFGSDDGTVTLRSISGPPVVNTLQGHSTSVDCLDFSPDGSILASGSRDGTIKIWNLADNTEIRTLQRKELFQEKFISPAGVSSLAFIPNGMGLVSGSSDGMLIFWNVSTGEEVTRLEGHTGRVLSVNFNPVKPILVSGGEDKTITLWDLSTFKKISSFHKHSDTVNRVIFSPDGALLASGSQDTTIQLWDLRGIPKAESLTLNEKKNNNRIRSVAFSPDGNLLVSGAYDNIILWNAADGHQIATLEEQFGSVDSVAFSPDGKFFVSGTLDGYIRFWSIPDGQKVAEIYAHSREIKGLEFSPDGKWLASGSDDRLVKIWDVENKTLVKSLHGHQTGVKSVNFNPDGTMLVSGSLEIKVWDTKDWSVIRTLENEKGVISSVCFNADSTLLASAGGKPGIKLWNIADGSIVTELQGHSEYITALAFSSAGGILASASNDQTIVLWSTDEWKKLTTLRGQNAPITSLAFRFDGNRLASGDESGRVKVWNLGGNDVLVRGCAWLQGYLKNNPNVSEEDRGMCDDILAREKTITTK